MKLEELEVLEELEILDKTRNSRKLMPAKNNKKNPPEDISSGGL